MTINITHGNYTYYQKITCIKSTRKRRNTKHSAKKFKQKGDHTVNVYK